VAKPALCAIFLVGGIVWTGHTGSFWPKVKEFGFFARLGQFEVGKSDGQTVVLTDHFTARSMNGKLDEVVDILRG
jgi:hypothetical protein